MTPRTFTIGFYFFSYSGNGGISCEHPSIREWYARTICDLKKDKRIENIMDVTLSDTPITMTRNRAVQMARQRNLDFLVMVDSDQFPDLYASIHFDAKPFIPSSLDYLIAHYDRGPSMIGAPYCGPPPHENVYVFKWHNHESDDPGEEFSLEQFSREEAATRSGIEPVAALPTGMTIWDVRVFDLVSDPIFYYEYVGDGDKCSHCGCRKPGPQAEKASTEDVTATRDISLNGEIKLGYNPVLCNWDSWVGHMKSKCVGKPKIAYADRISRKLAEALHENKITNERMTFIQGPSPTNGHVKKQVPT